MKYRGTDLAWAAGFLEGEGCFQINWGREGRNVSAVVNATQVDVEPLVRLQELFGGSLFLEPKSEKFHQKRDCWRWTVTTNFCREILPFLIPYMVGEKRAQAQFLNEFAESLVPQNGIPVSKREIARRDKARRKLSAMKGRCAV